MRKNLYTRVDNLKVKPIKEVKKWRKFQSKNINKRKHINIKSVD